MVQNINKRIVEPEQSSHSQGPRDQQQVDWPVTIFLISNLVLSTVLAVFYFSTQAWAWSFVAVFFLLSFLTNLSITSGYHRLFSHRSYQAHPIVRFFLILLGSGAWQGSVYQWATGHRLHHSDVDGESDPYSISKGFWFAHMKWMLLDSSTWDKNIKAAPDLARDPMVMFQHRHYIFLAILMGYLVPALLGWIFYDTFWGGLIVFGGLRIALTQQSTYFVNSLAHMFGDRTYTHENSARDNFFVALLTHGEGYHNFHHKFQVDYRNGIYWYQWDPTKWFIQFLSVCGLATRLRTVPASEILKARLQVESLRLTSRGFSAEKLEVLREKILHAQDQLRKLMLEYEQIRQQKSQSIADFRSRCEHQRAEFKGMIQLRRLELRAMTQLRRLELEHSLKQWRFYQKSPVVLG